MNRFWTTIIRPLLEAAKAKVIIEVGSEDGHHTRALLGHAAKANGRVHAVDPRPTFDEGALSERFGECFVMHRMLSLNAIPLIEPADAVLLDGDHNWFTVLNELRLLQRVAQDSDTSFPLTILHDVDWPYGRRDLYYDPETIPPAFRLPYRQGGIVPGHPELVAADGLNASLNNAIYEHSIQNGVRTAVEDFLREGPDLEATFIPGFHGLCVLASPELVAERERLRDLLADLAVSDRIRAFLDRLEQERNREAIRVASARQRTRDAEAREAETEAANRRLKAEVAVTRAELRALRAEFELRTHEIATPTSASPSATPPTDDESPSEPPGTPVDSDGHRAAAPREDAERALRSELGERHRAIERGVASHGWGSLGDPFPTDSRGLLRNASDTPGDLHLVVVLQGGLPEVRETLWTVLAKSDSRFALTLVDQGAEPSARAALDDFARLHSVRLVSARTDGMDEALLAPLDEAPGEILVVVRTPTLVTEGWLSGLLEAFERDPELMLAGPLTNAGGSGCVPPLPQAGGSPVPIPEWAGAESIAALLPNLTERSAVRVLSVPPGCWAVRTEAVRALAGRAGSHRTLPGALSASGGGIGLATGSYVYEPAQDAVEAPRPTRVEKLGVESQGRPRHLRDLADAFVDALVSAERFEELARRALAPSLAIRFVLPDIEWPAGAHSVYEEAAAMRRMSIGAVIAVPSSSMPALTGADAEGSDLFEPYETREQLVQDARTSDVVIATHPESVELVHDIRDNHPWVLPAYYLHDYEQLVAPAGSIVAAEAARRYGLLADGVWFAKSHWISNLISSVHGIHVHKVSPSLDRAAFHRDGRLADRSRRLAIAAMVHPHTVQRQPYLTLEVLHGLRDAAAGELDIVTFGCSDEELANLREGGEPPGDNRGHLSRGEMGELLRSTDIFLDLSAYRASGGLALEAMACGCVPVAPRIGGAGELAVDGVNAMLVDTRSAAPIVASVLELAGDRSRQAALSVQGMVTAERFSTTRAALSQYAILAAEHRRRFGKPALAKAHAYG